MASNSRETFLKHLNPDLPKDDYLYHLGLSAADLGPIREMFGDVVHVAMMGSGPRAFTFAQKLAQQTGGSHQVMSPEPNRDFDNLSQVTEIFEDVKAGRKDLLATSAEIQDWMAQEAGLPRTVGKTERYWMFAVDTPAGRVLSVNHHMGQPTHSILLHEVTKLLHHAGADSKKEPFEYTRLGTSGGLGVEPGTIVVANRGLEPSGEARYRLFSLGEEVIFNTDFDKALSDRIEACRTAVPDRTVARGDTVSCDDFYIAQGRLDGAFLLATEEQKLAYLNRLHDLGARNMEMEAAGFAGFTNYMGIPTACVGVTLLNRLKGDQVTATPAELAAYSDGPQDLLIEYLKRKGAAKSTSV